jgi:hypothetical protein
MRSMLLLGVFAFALTVWRPSLAGEVLLRGQFEGRSNHVASGAATVVLGEDFDFDGGPDPKVGFGGDGVYDKSSQLEALRSNTGRQEYVIPSSIDPAKYNEIYIWCERYSVPLGVAKLK